MLLSPFPARPRPGVEVIETSTRGESDPAVISLVAYAAAMTMFSRSLMRELKTARRDLGRARLKLCKESNPSAVTRAMDPAWQQFQAQGIPVNPDPAEEGNVDTTLQLGHPPSAASGRQAE